MDEREKEIEELAQAIFSSGVAIDGTDIAYGLTGNDSNFHRMAAKLIDSGYRKAEEVRKEAEHRAEVAERALEYACLDFATCYPIGTWNDFAVEYADRCRRQAERILKEERKDD